MEVNQKQSHSKQSFFCFVDCYICVHIAVKISNLLYKYYQKLKPKKRTKETTCTFDWKWK